MGFAKEDVAAFVRSQPHANAPAYAPGDERAGMHFHLDYYDNPDRGAIAAWKNEMAPMSWAHWLSFDGLSVAAMNRIPSLMIHGPDCALPDNARRAYERWSGPKQLEWTDGEQTDFYDRPQHVDRAIKAIDDWFKMHLGA